MKKFGWQIRIGVGLVVLSIIFYLVHYLVFHDAHHIWIFLVGDIAFVPIEVLLVTLIIHEMLTARERRSRFEKLNMVIGAFFSEVGTDLLIYLSDADPGLDQIQGRLVITESWTDQDFKRVRESLKNHEYKIDVAKVELDEFRGSLSEDRDFLLRLLENPNLLEHETFTELLFAVSHLTEELLARDDLNQLPPSDLAHLQGDTERAYRLLVREWLNYMEHLKKDYPYLFLLAMRTNPFDQSASPIVT